MPTASPYPITSGWGWRTWDDGSSELHDGVDWGTPMGTPVYAIESGTVNNLVDPPGYGRYVQLWLDSGGWLQYGHLSNNTVVPDGSHVEAGQLIAYSGNDGAFTTGPHLHVRYSPNGAHPGIDIRPWLEGAVYPGGGTNPGGQPGADPTALRNVLAAATVAATI